MDPEIEKLPIDTRCFECWRRVVSWFVRWFGNKPKIWTLRTKEGQPFWGIAFPRKIWLSIAKDAEKNGRTVAEEVGFYIRALSFQKDSTVLKVRKGDNNHTVSLSNQNPESSPKE